jgi:uncharacterized damage-inducible protein DinB
MCAHKEQLLGFARYNSEFNRRLFDQLAALPDEERKRDLGAFFGSIHGTLNHILLADRIWLGRFASTSPAMSSLHGAAVVHEFSSLRQELCADFDELYAERLATDRVISNWAQELSDEVLAETMRYRTSRGDPREHPVWIAVAHMFNHQTHHRGQVTTLMHQLGHDPGVTDYLVYVQ